MLRPASMTTNIVAVNTPTAMVLLRTRANAHHANHKMNATMATKTVV